MRAAEKASDLAAASADIRGDHWNVMYADDFWARVFQWRHRQAMRLWGCWSVKSKIPVGAPLPCDPSCGRRAGRGGNSSRPSDLLWRASSKGVVELVAFIALEHDSIKHTELLDEISQRCADESAAVLIEDATRGQMGKAFFQSAPVKAKSDEVENGHGGLVHEINPTQEANLSEQARKGIIINVTDLEKGHAGGVNQALNTEH